MIYIINCSVYVCKTIYNLREQFQVKVDHPRSDQLTLNKLKEELLICYNLLQNASLLFVYTSTYVRAGDHYKFENIRPINNDTIDNI